MNGNTDYLYWAKSFNRAWLDTKARYFLKKQVWKNNPQICI